MNSFATHALSVNGGDFADSMEGVVSLSDRLAQLSAEQFVDKSQQKSLGLWAVEQPGLVIDSDQLYKIQNITGQYNIDVSLLSSVVRKACGAVETVCRS